MQQKCKSLVPWLAVLVMIWSLVLALRAPTSVQAANGNCSNQLFFSEYVEGGSNNKALEIFNGTGSTVDLNATGAAYQVRFYFNGNSTPGGTIDLTGAVSSGDVHVLCDGDAVQGILDECNQQYTGNWFNGDDAIELIKNGIVVDVIGQVGTDPGAEWGSGLTSTADNTLRRKDGIVSGARIGSDAFDPATEWDGHAQDTFDGLGSHTIDTCSVWDGSVDSDWNDADNWTPSGVPGSTDNIVISDVASDPVLDVAANVRDIIVENGATLDLNSYDLTVARNLFVEDGGTASLSGGSSITIGAGGVVVNEGTLRETKTVNSADTVFLNISIDKYYGVEIKPGSNDLGSTTVSIRGNQTCGTGGTLPDTVKRCYDIVPSNQLDSTICFYYRLAEENGNIAPNVYHWNSSTSTWDLQTLVGRGGSGEGMYVEASGISSYSPFTLKDDQPTAITLSSFTAYPIAPQPTFFRWQWLTLVGVVGLVLGGGAVARRLLRR